jgi:hypothetical protein
MSDPTRALTVQLLEWIEEKPRTHAQVIEVWRSSCPRLSIWEDACSDGLIDSLPGSATLRVSERGRRLLADQACRTPGAPVTHSAVAQNSSKK